jgi:hypothetical protein
MPKYLRQTLHGNRILTTEEELIRINKRIKKRNERNATNTCTRQKNHRLAAQHADMFMSMRFAAKDLVDLNKMSMKHVQEQQRDESLARFKSDSSYSTSSKKSSRRVYSDEDQEEQEDAFTRRRRESSMAFENKCQSAMAKKSHSNKYDAQSLLFLSKSSTTLGNSSLMFHDSIDKKPKLKAKHVGIGLADLDVHNETDSGTKKNSGVERIKSSSGRTDMIAKSMVRFSTTLI